MTMHTKTVLSMLNYIGEDSSPYNLCNGPLCGWLYANATEFTLYLNYAHAENNRKPNLNCTHVVTKTDFRHEVAISLWRGLPTTLELTEKIATKQREPFMFGAQDKALDNIPWEKREMVAKRLVQIYEQAKLYNSTEDEPVDAFIQCIA